MGFVKELTEDLVPAVDAFLHTDPFTNAYAIWDLYHLRHRTRFFTFMDDGKVKGLLLDYLGHNDVHFIWIWDDENIADELLNVPLPKKMVFHVFPRFENVIKRKFQITAKYPIDFMILRKGNEQLHLKHEIKPLSLKDAYSFACLRKENPGEEEVKVAESFIKEQTFYGIFINSNLVSVACTHVKLPEIWILGGFYTRQEYRNRGYATSLASFLTKEALKETNHVGLYVRADNHPAKRVYQNRV